MSSIFAKLRLQIAAFLESQTNTGERTPSNFEDIFGLSLGSSEGSERSSERWPKARAKDEELASRFEKKKNKLEKKTSSAKDQIGDLRVKNEAKDTELPTLGDEWASLKMKSSSTNMVLDGPQIAASSKSDYVELFKERLER